ncbi:MAG: rhodanese-related sulfurtransferase [Bacteroidetes bacterium]|nr:MAG: rhodanese-related sulfurtransferase [Bacteroidota bacterium]REK04925.1 MAG: rhodanese-related sulfurtransferase [Bacteroidota bacterium]REK32874.1 MAG: rhodanese-related sulfurtransferase [Bacteroidota bacterium]REK50937.1 MAG: rhodanese-related sulfurtransferase [Bacteroidota bacterium]
MMQLFNKYDKHTLLNRLLKEDFKRKTLSFYRYVILENLPELRDSLYLGLDRLGVKGRIYIAREGINAQISVPEPNWTEFLFYLNSWEQFKNVDLKIAVEDDGKSFHKLIVRMREKIVADGLDDNSFDVTNVGKHLSAKEFNEAMELPDTIVVDMRNHYESEVGHFTGAILPDADTFRQELPMVLDMLKDKKDKKILLYCTGGIRCEKASAYLKHEGFTDVNQLNGGIIHYARQVKQEGLESKFIGKNFVFDNRLGERITEDVISECHQCGNKSDRHVNCANDECHLLFIQCEKCADSMNNCCTPACMETLALPKEQQITKRKDPSRNVSRNVYKSRLRPDLRKIISENKIQF